MHFTDLIKHKVSDHLVNLYCLERLDAEHRESLFRNGCAVVPNFLPADVCAQLVEQGRRTIAEQPQHVSLESNNSDKRIYGVDRLIPDFRLLPATQALDDCAKAFYRVDDIDYFQMLGNITYTESNLGSGGGWHRDSPYSHQFKFILYLSDVEATNGPFQYIKGTHSAKAVLRYSSRCSFPLSQYRFSQREVNTILEDPTYELADITGQAGTLLIADVKGLHRGKPLEVGERWATTRYYFKGTIPEHFHNLLPSKEGGEQHL
jgi:hypothetical protein